MKQSSKKGLKNQIGALGEDIACGYLKSKGFTIISQNYLKKWGEIDIVARAPSSVPSNDLGETGKNGYIIHFVEVKTVSYETKRDLERAVSHGTWRPEENVHFKKIQRLSRTIESWLLENNHQGEWQIDVLAVRMVTREKYATVKYLPNIFLD